MKRLAGVLLLAFLCSGCVVTETEPISNQIVVAPGENLERAERLGDLPDGSVVVQTSIGNSFSINPLGKVDYDGFTLPIVCPDHERRLLAVQSGTRPSWKTLLATSTDGAHASTIQIYEYSHINHTISSWAA